MINLGDKVKDSVTGFTGIAVARTEWLHGCMRILVQPDTLQKDGAVQEAVNFDEPQLLLIKAGKVAREPKPRPTARGGPKPAPQQKTIGERR